MHFPPTLNSIYRHSSRHQQVHLLISRISIRVAILPVSTFPSRLPFPLVNILDRPTYIYSRCRTAFPSNQKKKKNTDIHPARVAAQIHILSKMPLPSSEVRAKQPESSNGESSKPHARKKRPLFSDFRANRDARRLGYPNAPTT